MHACMYEQRSGHRRPGCVAGGMLCLWRAFRPLWGVHWGADGGLVVMPIVEPLKLATHGWVWTESRKSWLTDRTVGRNGTTLGIAAGLLAEEGLGDALLSPSPIGMDQRVVTWLHDPPPPPSSPSANHHTDFPLPIPQRQ